MLYCIGHRSPPEACSGIRLAWRIALIYSLRTPEDVLNIPCGKYFWAEIMDGRFRCGNENSFYGKHLDQRITFDIGNGKVLAHVDLTGSILDVFSYGESYAFDNQMPGVWVHHPFRRTPDMGFTLRLASTTYTLLRLQNNFRVSLLDNFVPIGEHFMDRRVVVKLITFAPISGDGSVRPRCVIHAIFLKNVSDSVVTGAVDTPVSDTHVGVTRCDGAPETNQEFALAPGEVFWLPVTIAPFEATDVLTRIECADCLEWLRSTLTYYRGVTGRLTTHGDSFLAELYERCMCQSVNSVVLTDRGEVSGQNSWGTYPTREETWMKDFHYSSMPLVSTAPEIGLKVMEWFLKWSVRYPGRFAGGVEHSVANALSPVAMAGFYYASSGDHRYFIDRPWVKDRCIQLLEQVLSLRGEGSNRFHTFYISDGEIPGDYHTGSHIFAWYCLKSFARILDDVYEETETASRFRMAADAMKAEVDASNVTEGPLGRQYAESINKDGSLPSVTDEHNGVRSSEGRPYLAQDGEESDTTLAPFYGYADSDEELLHNLKAFAFTSNNIFYSEALDGILWCGNTTFPGFISGLASSTSKDHFNRFIGRIRELLECDGSMVWWPNYQDWEGRRIYAAKDQVGRGLGKCAWGAGAFSCLFTSHFLGLSYDGPTRTLSFRPLPLIGDFEWKECVLGSGLFNLCCRRTSSDMTLEVENLTPEEITTVFRVVLPDTQPKAMELDSIPYTGPILQEELFGWRVTGARARIAPGQRKRLVTTL